MLKNLLSVISKQITAPKNSMLGRKGEKKACRYLKQNSYAVLERNWKSHPYEIDIICMDKKNKELVFVEVKTRHNEDKEQSLEAFTPKKQQNIIKGATLYLNQKGLWDHPCRFDLICINGETLELEHFCNVITQ